MSASPVGTPPAGLVCVRDQQQRGFASTDIELLSSGSLCPSLTRPLMLNGFCPNRRASCGAHIDLNQFAFSPGLFRCMVKGDSSD